MTEQLADLSVVAFVVVGAVVLVGRGVLVLARALLGRR